MEGLFHNEYYIIDSVNGRGVPQWILYIWFSQWKGCFTMNIIKLIQSMEGMFHNEYYQIDSMSGRGVPQWIAVNGRGVPQWILYNWFRQWKGCFTMNII